MAKSGMTLGGRELLECELAKLSPADVEQSFRELRTSLEEERRIRRQDIVASRLADIFNEAGAHFRSRARDFDSVATGADLFPGITGSAIGQFQTARARDISFVTEVTAACQSLLRDLPAEKRQFVAVDWDLPQRSPITWSNGDWGGVHYPAYAATLAKQFFESAHALKPETAANSHGLWSRVKTGVAAFIHSHGVN
jgi:hypothetical protein